MLRSLGRNVPFLAWKERAAFCTSSPIASVVLERVGELRSRLFGDEPILDLCLETREDLAVLLRHNTMGNSSMKRKRREQPQNGR